MLGALSHVFDSNKSVTAKIRRKEKPILISADLISFFVSYSIGMLAYFWAQTKDAANLELAEQSLSDPQILLYVTLAMLSIAWMWNMGHYSRRKPFWDEVKETCKVISILALIDAALLLLAQIPISRLSFLLTWITALITIPLLRTGCKKILIRAGKWQLPTVIIGAGTNAKETAAALHAENLMGYDITTFLALPHETIPEEGFIELQDRCVPTIRLSERPFQTIQELGNPNIVIALDNGDLNHQLHLVNELHRKNGNVSVVPSFRGLPLYGMETRHFFRHEVLFLEMRNNLSRQGPKLVKRFFDITASFFLLTILSPLLSFIAYQVKKDGGPAIYRHRRVGQNGEFFDCYKFRSMDINAERKLKELLASSEDARKEWEKDFKLKKDPRITKIGRFLRKSSLDELPQLLNVLKGEMSLVGPRPIVSEEVARYGEQKAFYLETKPGITGLWQISGRNDVDYKSRVNLDVWYVKNWSLWYDVVILLKTIRVVLNKAGAY